MVRIVRFVDAAGAPSRGVEAGGRVTYADGCPFAGTLRDTGRTAEVRSWLPPVEPRSLLCIGLNYRKHADELGLPYPHNPVVFFKAPNAATGHLNDVVKPRVTERLDWEVELAVVIGRACKDVPTADALSYVLGYTTANDISTRDWQKMPELGGGQWSRSKTFDGLAPLGPCLVTADEIPDPNALRVRSFVNGQKMQDSNTADLIFNVQQLISFLSIGTTLEPGTVILTGTPAGVGDGIKPTPRYLQPGDTVVVEVEGIGELRNTIVADRSTAVCYYNLPPEVGRKEEGFMQGGRPASRL